jgi:PadR family transcriptional regulator, regulatory protein PadR
VVGIVVHLYRVYDIGYTISNYKSIAKPIPINPQNPNHKPMTECGSKGFLSFLIVWLSRKQPLTGAEIAQELEKRRGKKPSPGTIYPVLKNLTNQGILTVDPNKRYSLTEKGQKTLESAIDEFINTFYDVDEMRFCMHEKKKTIDKCIKP